jgi:hypothetical protein
VVAGVGAQRSDALGGEGRRTGRPAARGREARQQGVPTLAGRRPACKRVGGVEAAAGVRAGCTNVSDRRRDVDGWTRGWAGGDKFNLIERRERGSDHTGYYSFIFDN